MSTPPAPIVQHLDQSSEFAVVNNIVAGAHVSIYRNGSETDSADASSGAVRVTLSERLAPGDIVTAAQSVGGVTSALSTPVAAELNHTTHQFNRQRTGWNPYETSLNVANVASSNFGFLFAQPVDGQIYAQPLYVQNVEFTRIDAHGKTVTTFVNVLYVVTENDSVYAFDADNNVPPLRYRRLVPPGERVVVLDDLSQQVKDSGWVWTVLDGWHIYTKYKTEICDNIAPHVGITATPVIDRTTNTLYVTAKTVDIDGTKFHWRLYALDLTTLADKQPPTEIQASVPGLGDGSPDGMVKFDPHWQLNRPALLLSNGVVYVPFGSHCDFGTWHGWLMAYDATDLKMLGVFNTSPDQDQAGIWLSGCGPAADTEGNIYLATGNGSFNAGSRDYGQSVLKLKLELIQGRPGPVATQPGPVTRSAFPPHLELTLVDYFTPHDWNQPKPGWGLDWDLGSGGVMVLPPQPHAAAGHPTPRRYPTPPPLPNLLFACGKNKGIYLLDPANLGGYTLTDNGLLQKPPQPIGTEVFGGPAYFEGPAGHFVYYCGHRGPLRAFSVVGTALSPATQSAETFWGPNSAGGAIPTVSSNGSTAGTGVVWVVGRCNRMHLFAYDATNVSVKLFEGEAGSWNNPGGSPFVAPTVIHGKVYVGTATQVAFFGLGGVRNIPTGFWGSIIGLLNRLRWWMQILGVFIRRRSFRTPWRPRRRN